MPKRIIPIKALTLPPEERRRAAQSVKITGRTLRFKGNIDLDAAAKYFALPEDARRAIKFINVTDVWRIHAMGMLPIVADFFKMGIHVDIRVVENPAVERHLRLYGYEHALTRGAFDAATAFRQGARQFILDDHLPNVYVDSVFDEILKRARRCGKDVARGLEWALSELIGNVFHHAETRNGAFVQFVVLPQENRSFFTLVDTGRGLRDVLNDKFSISKHRDAIELAIQKGVTSKRENQGWGLFGSTSIIRQAGGRFVIWTGDAALVISPRGTYSYREMPFFQGTAIEWEIPTNINIDLREALEAPLEPVAILLEKYEPTIGTIVFEVAKEAASYRERATGRLLRHKLIGLIDATGATRCILDFAGVRLVSSSFADELVAKTFFLRGRDTIALINADSVNAGIIDASIVDRMRSEAEAAKPQRIVSRPKHM